MLFPLQDEETLLLVLMKITQHATTNEAKKSFDSMLKPAEESDTEKAALPLLDLS
jgi:hypothetical protein